MSATNEDVLSWRCKDRMVELPSRGLIMGVLNVTPDSFSDGGSYINVDAAVKQALQMVSEGADIIDIGGESSRPGAASVSLEEELRRVIPVLEEIVKQTGCIISIDTCKSTVAHVALGKGAHIINDITALRGDLVMKEVIKEYRAGVILMHMQGTPGTMQLNPLYNDVVKEVGTFLKTRMEELVDEGVLLEQISVDPGIGFGKRMKHNLSLLSHLLCFKELRRPLTLGVSRKRIICDMINRNVEDRLAGSLGLLTYGILHGADIIRVHDVKESMDIIRMMETLKRGSV